MIENSDTRKQKAARKPGRLEEWDVGGLRFSVIKSLCTSPVTTQAGNIKPQQWLFSGP
jgi:hypothetical protein